MRARDATHVRGLLHFWPPASEKTKAHASVQRSHARFHDAASGERVPSAAHSAPTPTSGGGRLEERGEGIAGCGHECVRGERVRGRDVQAEDRRLAEGGRVSEAGANVSSSGTGKGTAGPDLRALTGARSASEPQCLRGCATWKVSHVCAAVLFDREAVSL